MDPPPAAFEFHALGRKILIKEAGTIRAGKSRPRVLRLGMTDSSITGVCFAEYRHDLLLLLGVDDGESVGAVLVRLDGKNLHRKWRSVLPATSAGPSVIEGRFAYVTGGGFAGKADLVTGKFRWQHSTWLGSTLPFLEYRTPVIRTHEVVLSEPADLLHPRSVTVSRRTGKVLVAPHYH